MESQVNCLFITYVEKEGPFLKVWGQMDKTTSLYVEQVLHSFTAQFDNGLGIPHPETLQIGVLCCAKYKDNKYYRSRVTSLNYLHNRYIEVNFVDYGNRDVVPIGNIRSLEGFETAFISIPPQASCFVLAEAVCPRGEWNDVYLDEICKEIRYTEVHFAIVAQVTRHYLVRLFVGVNDLATILISKDLMRRTSLTTQEAVLLSMMPRTMGSPQQPQQSIATYKAFTLEPGSQYEVYVSYVTDGPCNFSVQLKQSEEVLGKLMKEINSMTLTPVEGIPIPGTVCLTRCMEDGHICRAVVTNEVDGQFKVFYVDFGNFEVVPLESLYEIPFKYVIPKVMAIRFALSGIEKSTVTLEMQCAFKQFVDNRLIHMKVMPMTTRTALPRCELWDPETQISALDVVNQAASAGYPDHISLNRGFSQPIKISYVFSCNRFYVQLKSKQDDLARLMLDIQVICRDADFVPRNAVKVGLPCYAQFEVDQQWYRCQVCEVAADGTVKIQYVDYGNEETAAVTGLKVIEGKQLTVLRPQAIECCLNGYQNMEPDQERDMLLEELILEQEFTMKVVEMQGKKALIELIDSANYNVASLLLEKIALTRSQVSPMLVQGGNKIEHRKSNQSYKEQRRSTDSNETNEFNSWRQNNKGFNKNERNRPDSDLNSSTDSENLSNKSYRNKNDFNTKTTEGSWKQNKGFSKSNEWGGGREERNHSKEKDDWNEVKENDNSPKSKDNWNSNREDRKNYNTRNRDDRFSNRGENMRKGYHSKTNVEWNGTDTAVQNKDAWEEKKGNDNWDGRRDKRDNWENKRNNDGWNNREEKRNNDNWDNKGSKNWGNQENRRDNNGSWDNKGNRRDNNGWDKREERKNNDNWTGDTNDNWGNKEDKRGFRPKDDNFRKGKHRETSEFSSSGSEKSFKKGINKKPQSWNAPNSSKDVWNVGSGKTVETPDAAPNDAKFKPLQVDGTESNVIISWFHNPGNFYCQLENTQSEFKQLMNDIQQAYKDRTASSCVVGAPVIGLFPEDGVLYRAEILEVLGSQFKIYYVDFGNVSIINKVWPIEMRFMELPAQAVCCKLSGIEAVGDAWPEASKFSPYFDKKQFLCKFLATENDRVAVMLECDSEDIASALVRDGLAKSVTIPQPPELPLFIGQQFKAMLISVNGLADFLVSLQSGFVLKCAIFNLGESTETWEDALKAKLEQILIIYVDDLKDDRLEVTLYNETGAKIKLIDKDEGAYESVELICPYLVQYSSVSGEITHIEDNTIYLQPADCAQNIEYLLNSLFEYYDSATVESAVSPVEGFVYAVKSSDGNWYRGRVVSVGDDKTTVNYLDYGNSEEVEFSSLRELVAGFMDIPITCIGVILNQTSEDLLGKFVTVDLAFTETGVEGTIREEPLAESIPQQETPQIDAVSAETPQSYGTEVVVSHTDSPSDFYLQLADSIPAIDDLQATLQEQINDMADIETPVIGVLCAAPYSLDQQWYRAHVLDADSDITTVRFVDYGNTDVLDNQTTRVKTLPPNLLSLEVHATRCRLKIKPVDEEWSSAASERFEQLCGGTSLTAQFISQDEKTNYVELYADGTKVREVLIAENLALPDEVVPDTSSAAFVSHQNSPSEFWIQLENCIEELEWVAERLSGAETFPELEELAPGALCAALFPEDQNWYRARILSNTVAGIEVVFVDYGNSCTSCNLRELPEDLVMVAPLAQKCSLQKPPNLTNWGPNMARKFADISAEGQTTLHVNKLSTGETALVQLLLEGVDVATLLIPKTEDVKVKSFKGLDEIVLEGVDGKYRLESLPDITWNEDSEKKFAELNNDGKTVFQAEFGEDNNITLYLGLNDIRLELSGTKAQTSSPIKSRAEVESRQNLHSPDDATNHVKSLVDGLVEASTNKSDTAFIEQVVDDVISRSVPNENNTDLNESELVQDKNTELNAEQLIKNNSSVSAADDPHIDVESVDVKRDDSNQDVNDEVKYSLDEDVKKEENEDSIQSVKSEEKDDSKEDFPDVGVKKEENEDSIQSVKSEGKDDSKEDLLNEDVKRDEKGDSKEAFPDEDVKKEIQKDHSKEDIKSEEVNDKKESVNSRNSQDKENKIESPTTGSEKTEITENAARDDSV